MIKMNFKPTGINITLFVIGIALVIIGYPLLAIWSLNTLFPSLQIPYALETWAAAILIRGFLFEFMTVKKKD